MVDEFSGVIPALITPMKKFGAVDWHHCEHFYGWHQTQPTSAVVVLGSTGEGLSLTMSEKQQLLNMSRRVLKDKKIIVGISSVSTQQAIELAQQAQTSGADALLLAMSPYIKPTQQNMINHVNRIAQSTNLPIIIYEIPSRNAVSIYWDTLKYLLDQPLVVGVKDSSANMSFAGKLLQYKRKKSFSYLSGDDDTSWVTSAAGGDGVISVLANLLPSQMQAWMDECAVKSYPKKSSSTKDAIVTRALELLAKGGNPSMIKYLVASCFGFNPACRMPLDLPDLQLRQEMDVFLNDYKSLLANI